MLIDDGTGGIASETVAPFTFLFSEPTLHSFTPELVEDAQRNTYRADLSGVVYSLVLAGEVYKNMRTNATLVATVAGQLAAVWDENAAVPGVADIVETQDVSPLGSLTDVFQIAVQSDSQRSTAIITVQDQQVRPDVFAGIVAAERAALNAQETAR